MGEVRGEEKDGAWLARPGPAVCRQGDEDYHAGGRGGSCLELVQLSTASP